MTWYIAVTNPNCHRRAEAELASLGYRAFWPKMRKWVKHARAKVPKEYPILGRYLFVEIHDENFWAVRRVNGIEGILTGDLGAPAPIPRHKVMDFECRYHAGEWDLCATGTLPIGARVKLIEGEFAKQMVTILGMSRGKIKCLPPTSRKFVYVRPEKVWVA